MRENLDKIMERYDAFWEYEVSDRPPVYITVPRDKQKILPEKEYSSLEERWLDVEHRALMDANRVGNTNYLGDAVPTVFPNLGPEIFSAWCGCGYEFGENTAWSEPCIFDWEKDYDKSVLDTNHPLFQKTVEYTKLLTELGKDKFAVGLTDVHAGGDHLAALRGPDVLAMDMIDSPEYIKRKLKDSEIEFFKIYDYFYDLM
jgi:hypothetical protein